MKILYLVIFLSPATIHEFTWRIFYQGSNGHLERRDSSISRAGQSPLKWKTLSFLKLSGWAMACAWHQTSKDIMICFPFSSSLNCRFSSGTTTEQEVATVVQWRHALGKGQKGSGSTALEMAQCAFSYCKAALPVSFATVFTQKCT